MAKEQGYWFNTTTGEIIDVSESRHIIEVCDHPEKFGVTTDIIVEEYKKYNERIPFEGRARLELIKRIVLNTDWVRIREYSNANSSRVTINFREYIQKDIVAKTFDFGDLEYNFSLIRED